MKPKDFFLGVVEFFGIVVPGSIAAWLILVAGGMDLLPTSGSGRAFAFFVAAYIAGHVLHAFGAVVLDSLYDALKLPTFGERAKWRMGRDRAPLKKWLDTPGLGRGVQRVALIVCFGCRAGKTLHGLRKDIRASRGDGLKASEDYLRMHDRAMLQDAQMTLADSKLFRSLTFVMLGLFVLEALNRNWLYALGSLFLVWFSLHRSFNLRVKYSRVIYRFRRCFPEP